MTPPTNLGQVADLRVLSAPQGATREVSMSQNPVLCRDELLMQNEEYRRLSEQHHEYEARLTTLIEKAVLSDDEQLEETTLKKKKLQLKDRMESLARQIRSAEARV
jgi:uncharacterized protein YdcH (DUF465 family)